MYPVGVTNLNQVFSSLSTRRRYEVWFLRLGLADGSGAWWFRYLLMNPGRGGCALHPSGMPVQVWATWFPRDGKPQSFIQGFPLADFGLSERGRSPFFFEIGNNGIDEDSCRGRLQVDDHDIAWDLRYRSTFGTTLSSMGWIGFSRTPHSDAAFSGKISLNGRTFDGEPLGHGLQGHNSGYRHRNLWTWTHAYFPNPSGPASTFEALVYEMPLGMRFRRAVLWHGRKLYIFRDLRERRRDSEHLQWEFKCSRRGGEDIEVAIGGSSKSIHHLPYLKTDCSGSFEVTNNSLAWAQLVFKQKGNPTEEMRTDAGAVLEMAGP
ncbi:MAG: hypothetical protein LAN83_17140 [Acidobacteriia bacterium]|nr:hypothetical protein [Terriglobia bacterium]